MDLLINKIHCHCHCHCGHCQCVYEETEAPNTHCGSAGALGNAADLIIVQSSSHFHQSWPFMYDSVGPNHRIFTWKLQKLLQTFTGHS